MHPEILRALVAEHGRELREQAHQGDAGPDREPRGCGPCGAAPAGRTRFAVPAIPDYVDGSFRTAGDEAADRVPAARHAA